MSATGRYTVKVEKDGVQYGPTYTIGAEDALEALFAALSIAKASPERQVNAPRPDCSAPTRVAHFQCQGDVRPMVEEIERFLAEPGREFVELTHARTDPPNNTTAAFLVYRERETRVTSWQGS